VFAHSSGLSRHKKVHTEISNSFNTTHSHNTINSHNTTNNITNNYNVHIHLHPFGEETTEHIENDEEFLKKCIGGLITGSIPNLVENIFFNDEVPQNHNVQLKREHFPGKMMVYKKDGDTMEWREEDLENVVANMITKSNALLIRCNNRFYCFDDLTTEEEKELHDIRMRKFNAVATKKRGVYGPIKSGVISIAKDARRREK
jgi:hypothetical protein